MSSLAVEIIHPRTRTASQRQEQLRVNALRKHPYFNEIVKRIVAGQSAAVIARWCESAQSQACGVKMKTFFTWRQDIMLLAKRIRVLFKASELERPLPTPELVEEVIDQVRRDNYIQPEPDGPELKPKMSSVWHSVKRAIRQVDSEMVLKCAFLVHADRIERLIKKEEAEDKLDENGYKEILAMKDIGAELRKFEVGEQMLRGGKSYNYGGEYSRKPAELHAATTTPPLASGSAEPTVSDTNSFVARVSRLDEVDRNLLIAASSCVIDMIDSEMAKRVNPKTSGVEAGSGSEARAEAGFVAGAVSEDEPASENDIPE